jgi:hypothetical protein
VYVCARIYFSPRGKVDEEEMGEYPLLPETSRMHYFSAPSNQDDYPGYKEDLRKWGEWSQSGLNATADRSTPVLLNYVEVLNIRVEEERKLRYERAFTELVIRRATKDIIGFWYQGGPRQRVLDTLCSRTAFARLITRKPHPGLEFNHSYEEIGDETSRLNVWIRDAKSKQGRDVGCFYLLDFAPRDIFIIRAKFPTARIVGITVPGPTSEADIVKILATKKRIAEARAAAKEAEPKE